MLRLDKTQAEQLNDLMKELDNKNKKEMDKTMRLSKQDFERKKNSPLVIPAFIRLPIFLIILRH